MSKIKINEFFAYLLNIIIMLIISTIVRNYVRKTLCLKAQIQKNSFFMEQNPQVKTYTQDEVDSIVNQVKTKAKEKFDSLVADKYVLKDDFAKLQETNASLVKQVNTPKIQQALISAGCKKECVDDLIQLNNGLLNLEEKDIKANVEKCRSERPYMFNNQFAAETGNNTAPTQNSDKSNTIEGMSGTIFTRTTKI